MTARRRGQGAAETGITPRERILDAFAARARTRGIRGVVMGDLARELGMSKKTLYQHFESKNCLVGEIVQRWVARTRQHAGSPNAPLHDAHELVRWWTDLWIKEQTDFCSEFWRDLEEDHPEVWKIFQGVRDAGAHVQARVAQWFRPDIVPAVASELYFLIVGYFNDPVVCSRFGFDRRQAVLAAIDVWIGGALRPAASPDPETEIEPAGEPEPS